MLLLLRAQDGTDIDGDGLDSGAEAAAGTSPFLEDTDGDGLSDGEEINPPAGTPATDPTDRDTDGDGRLDGEEISPTVGPRTDPTLADSDGDQISDGLDGHPLDHIVYYHGDHLQSTTILTNARGDIVSRLLYKPYGEAIPAVGDVPEFAFGGQRFEAELGIYDHGARFYDPELARFISPDEIVPEPKDPQSLNRYSYVRNNPLNRIDPSGGQDYGFDDASFGSTLWNGFMSFMSEPIVVGTLNVVGGTLEAVAGATACTTGVGCAIGAVAFVHGVDTAWAGLKTLDEGVVVDNYTTELLASTGLERDTARLLNAGIGVASAVGTARAIAATSQIGSSLPRAAPSLGFLDETGSLADNAARAPALNPAFQRGFSSHPDLVKYLGPAGEGRAWHHIVEQTPANIARFGPERIHNVSNIVNVAHGKGSLHSKITGFYSSRAPGGGRIRDWVGTKSFEEQYEFGARTLERFFTP